LSIKVYAFFAKTASRTTVLVLAQATLSNTTQKEIILFVWQRQVGNCTFVLVEVELLVLASFSVSITNKLVSYPSLLAKDDKGSNFTVAVSGILPAKLCQCKYGA